MGINRMTRPSDRTVKREIARLREFIDANMDDPASMRIAYAVETALRWATSQTCGWPLPLESCALDAALLKLELLQCGRAHTGGSK